MVDRDKLKRAIKLIEENHSEHQATNGYATFGVDTRGRIHDEVSSYRFTVRNAVNNYSEIVRSLRKEIENWNEDIRKLQEMDKKCETILEAALKPPQRN